MSTPLRGGTGLNFAIVGEGSDRRIFAFASVSSLTLLSGGESQKNDHGWTCNHCSYENADAWSLVCPVCGFGKDGADHNKRRGRSGSIRRNGRHPLAHEMSLSVESLMLHDDDDDKDTPLTPMKSSTRMSQTDSQKLQKEFMMSYANWSLSDKGGWICSSCTFINQNSLHLTCDVCQQVRPAKEMIAPQPPSQRSFQEFMNASIAKLGQEESFQQQRERLLQLEERSLEEERMKEIAQMQRELFDKIAAERDEKKKGEVKEESKEEAPPPSSPRQNKDAEAKEIVDGCLDELEEAKRVLERTQERIRRLETLRQQQMEEQTKMEEMLQQQTEMSRRACSIGDSQNDTTSPEYLAQQKMLDFWREEFECREGRMEEIRKQQDELLRKIRQQ